MLKYDLGKVKANSIKTVEHDDEKSKEGEFDVYAVRLEDGTRVGDINIPKAQVIINNSGVPEGVASLDEAALVPREQLPLAKLSNVQKPLDECRGTVKISVVNNTAYIWTD
ncbi:MAG: hypothetical protein K2K12_06050 [Clostridia bacterium]|nr:hypothetical protein [Clostridia bacterium]